MPLSGALDDQRIELMWGEDRAALRACGNQLRALATVINLQQPHLLHGAAGLKKIKH